MNILDITLLIILFLFFWSGFWFGLIQTLGNLVGTLVGAFVASIYYEMLASWFSQILPWTWSGKVIKVLSFLVIFVIVARLIGFIFQMIDKTFKLISIIPFLKTINRLAGGLLGLILGAVVLGFAFFIYSKYPFWPDLDVQIAKSQVVPMLFFIIGFLLSFVPEDLKQLKGVL